MDGWVFAAIGIGRYAPLMSVAESYGVRDFNRQQDEHSFRPKAYLVTPYSWVIKNAWRVSNQATVFDY